MLRSAFLLAACLATSALAQERPDLRRETARTMILAPLDDAAIRPVREVRITPEMLDFVEDEERAGRSGGVVGEVVRAAEFGGCVAMDQKTADALFGQVMCGADERDDPFADLDAPQVDTPDGLDRDDHADDDDVDPQGVVNDLRSQTGPDPYTGGIKVDDSGAVDVDLCRGTECGGTQLVIDFFESDEPASLASDPVIDQQVRDAIDASKETTTVTVDAPDGFELVFPFGIEVEVDDAPDDGDTPDDASSDRPGPDDTGEMPEDCKDLAEEELGGNVDPIDPEQDAAPASGLYLGCFRDAEVLDTLAECDADREARFDGEGSLCTIVQEQAAFPFLTRNDLVIDPAEGDVIGDREPTPPPVGPDAPAR